MQKGTISLQIWEVCYIGSKSYPYHLSYRSFSQLLLILSLIVLSKQRPFVVGRNRFVFNKFLKKALKFENLNFHLILEVTSGQSEV